ncbi:hypothetical protein F9C07_11249 [Aspergillus flavus]|uniref:Uncharacterized protein n=2 Tax=Aspergillus flavus TaxID=5059 RepID=B8NS27_ASPFN|nr:uncharacterized protein G4B84_000176 [Aspergillus flavus NRRL3357]KAJ1714347.1 hypothetical protein NYO67_3558 [Aspergillus flavus]KAF7630535.1 hypothetical protein AFLA_011157 [Aspergillus flavus NRRL3357]QMW24931.1 hypothetical protein G4B84_000176 [Aspergillus flavus NRRL3357]QMW36931.1 hypothetical protein G4B11_000167 [Aspergillus flavus]QRD89157.1 hypothetical protein F9C07_11249 [Aspergillus flavus]
MAKVDAAADSPSAASPNHSLPQGPVEARSLSSITAVASNPPAYPRNPTQKKLDPLVLYIVRVPGSKDVFLSPLKPPTKASVSAEAINASLYYLHVSTPEDDVLLQECEQEREEEAKLRRELGEEADVPPEFAKMNHVRRKPVPGGGGGAKVDADARPPLPAHRSNVSLPENVLPVPNSADLPLSLMPARPGLMGSRSSIDLPQSATQMTTESRDGFLGHTVPGDEVEARPPLSARPLPPVPKDELAFELIEDNSAPKKANRWSALSGYMPGRNAENWKEKYEVLTSGRHSLDSRRPQARPQSAHANPSYNRMGSPARSPGQSPSRRPYDSKPPERPGFHITLIRRDPTHGSQWNVATISTPKMDGGAIDIEVSTPGYNRFAAQSEPLSLASLGINLPSEMGNRISLSSFRPTQAELAESTPTQPSHPRKFHRKLCVSRPYQEDGRGSLDLGGNRPSLDNGTSSPSKHSGSKLKSGYYTFTSPWNGTCTFSTSVNGRSLKCKHMIPMPSTGPNGASIDNPAVTVAEIRFNTPFQAGHLHHQPGPSHISPFTLSQTPAFKDLTSNPNNHGHGHNLDPSPSSPSDRTSKRASLAQFLNPNNYNRPRARSGASAHSTSSTSNFGVPTRKPSTSSTSSGVADLDDGPRRPLRRPPSEDRLDLSLARENAGGGMRGKSAKLGKLIIEDEGIKMLDLLVASCMAVWWRGYYY